MKWDTSGTQAESAVHVVAEFGRSDLEGPSGLTATAIGVCDAVQECLQGR
jgi:hypothetical protein